MDWISSSWTMHFTARTENSFCCSALLVGSRLAPSLWLWWRGGGDPMSPSISSNRDGSTEGGRESTLCPWLGFHTSNWDGVVLENTSCRHWHKLSQDSALNLDPLDNTRFSKQEMPDLANCSLSC